MNDFFNNKFFENYPIVKFILIFIIITLAFILFLNLIAFIVNRFSEKNKSKFSYFKSIIFALALPIGAFYVWYSLSGNPFNEYLLITKSKTIKGFITKAEEFEDVVETNNGNSVIVYFYHYEYKFTLPDGNTIPGYGTEDGTLPEYLKKLENKPYPIVVEYLFNDPEINRVKGMIRGNKTVNQWIRNRVVVGIVALLFFSYIGFTIIKESRKKYVIAKKTYFT